MVRTTLNDHDHVHTFLKIFTFEESILKCNTLAKKQLFGLTDEDSCWPTADYAKWPAQQTVKSLDI